MLRFKLGKSSFRTQSYAFISGLALILNACGPSAPEYHPADPRTVSGTAESQKPRESGSTPVVTESNPGTNPDSMADSSSTPAPENKTPAAPLTPPRTAPNAAEKTAMSDLYAAPNNQGGCAGCHGALNASAKKGRTAQQIANSQTIIQHRTVAAANKWPKDTGDASNDGVDNAQLYLSAMVEILK